MILFHFVKAFPEADITFILLTHNIGIWACICVCVCMCVTKRYRERGSKDERENVQILNIQPADESCFALRLNTGVSQVSYLWHPPFHPSRFEHTNTHTRAPPRPHPHPPPHTHRDAWKQWRNNLHSLDTAIHKYQNRGVECLAIKPMIACKGDMFSNGTWEMCLEQWGNKIAAVMEQPCPLSSVSPYIVSTFSLHCGLISKTFMPISDLYSFHRNQKTKNTLTKMVRVFTTNFFHLFYFSTLLFISN